MGRIVVGIDGSVGAQQALEWALDEARRRASTLEVVYAFGELARPRPFYSAIAAGLDPRSAQLDAAPATDLRGRAERLVEEAVRDVPGGGRGVTIVPRTIDSGHTAQVLVNQSRGADLLVVGSRGLGGFSGLLLGSVSQSCVQYALCPVVVVRPPTG